MTKVYICGKVTGDPFYRMKFYEADNQLESVGLYPVDPASFIPTDTAWLQAMRWAIRAMMLCDGVALLPDWKKSKGAKIEARLARQLGLEVKPLKKWLLTA